MRTRSSRSRPVLAMAIIAVSPLSAQGIVEQEVFDGVRLAEGLDMGVNTSGERADWVGPDGEAMKMAYPPGQAWGAVFITVGVPKDPPRPSWDLSAYETLLVDVKGDPGSTLEIGIKDARQPDNGTEQKVIVPVYSAYRTYAIPLAKFNRVDVRNVYVVTEFVFSGSQAQSVWFRNIRYTSAAAPDVGEILNGASFREAASAGGWVSLFGDNLSSTERGWEDQDFDGMKLPTSLDGVSVNVNDRDMAVAYVGASQINALIFHDVTTGESAYISVTNGLGTSVPVRVVIRPIYPALFSLPPEAGRYVAAVHLDGTIVGRPGLCDGDVVTRPARSGDIIQLFGTGFGPTSPPPMSDEIVSSPAPLADGAELDIKLGNTSATVLFAGLVGPGLYQFNVVVPEIGTGDLQLKIELNGVAMEQDVYLTVGS